MTKRQIVEEYLQAICEDLGLAALANDPYPVDPEYIQRSVEAAAGLIWLDDDGDWYWDTPTDAQVETIYAAQGLEDEDHG